MKITKSQLKRIIQEELEKLHDQARETAAKNYRLGRKQKENKMFSEGGAFASDEEIENIVNVLSDIDPGIQSWNEFHEAGRIAWNEGRLGRYEPSMHELRQAWKKHPGNMFTHDVRAR